MLGNYELLGLVAENATSAVWQGRDTTLDRLVALKQVRLILPEIVGRLRSEASMLAQLQHHNIVRVYELLEDDADLWLVEEWINGAPLNVVGSRMGRLTPQQAVALTRGALEGLGYAHRNQLVHGDFTPANVLIDATGTARLVDFGLAAPAGVPGVSGTPGYLAPEIASGSTLTPRVDVYAAGAVLSGMLLGRPLFAGNTAEQLIGQQLRAAAPPLHGIGEPFHRVLNQALALDPSVRPADANELLGMLDEAAERRFGIGWLGSAGTTALGSAAATIAAAALLRQQSAAQAAAAGTVLPPAASAVEGASTAMGAAAVGTGAAMAPADRKAANLPDPIQEQATTQIRRDVSQSSTVTTGSTPLRPRRKISRSGRWPRAAAAAAVTTGVIVAVALFTRGSTDNSATNLEAQASNAVTSVAGATTSDPAPSPPSVSAPAVAPATSTVATSTVATSTAAASTAAASTAAAATTDTRAPTTTSTTTTSPATTASAIEPPEPATVTSGQPASAAAELTSPEATASRRAGLVLPVFQGLYEVTITRIDSNLTGADSVGKQDTRTWIATSDCVRVATGCTAHIVSSSGFEIDFTLTDGAWIYTSDDSSTFWCVDETGAQIPGTEVTGPQTIRLPIDPTQIGPPEQIVGESSGSGQLQSCQGVSETLYYVDEMRLVREE